MGDQFLFLLLIVGVVMVLAYRQRQNAPPSSLYVSLPPKRSMEFITSEMLREGLSIAYRDETAVTFTRAKKPNADLAILLLVLGIIPGLLYLGLFRGTATTTITAVRFGDGTQLALSGDDRNAQNHVAWIVENSED